MRKWIVLLLALLVAACTGAPVGPMKTPPSQVDKAPPVKPALGPSGPRQLEIDSRTNGWIVRASTDSNTGRDQLNGPSEVWWLAPSRALVRWHWNPDSAYLVIDLENGNMTELPLQGRLDSLSPNGDYAVHHLPGRAESWLIHLVTEERPYQLPPNSWQVTWLTPSLLHVVYGMNGERALLYDLATQTETPMPEGGYPAALIAGREVCYARQVERVLCVHIGGGDAKLISPERLHPDVVNAGAQLYADPSGRYIAMVYPKAPRLNLRFTSTAHAMSIMSVRANPWADELAVYDGLSGQTNRYPLGAEYRRDRVLWSPDGTRLGLALGRITRKGASVTLTGVTEFWTLEVATGQLAKVAEVQSETAHLHLVTSAGEMIYRPAYGQAPMIAAPGREPQVWAPELSVFPTTPTALEGMALAFYGENLLEVRTGDGSVHRWRWEGAGDPNARISMSPGGTWAAVGVGTHEPGSLTFLKR